MEQKRAKFLAATLLKVGVTKIWVNPLEGKRVAEAMTKDDVRQLIKERVVAKRRTNLHSRGGARVLAAKKAKGRKRGFGKRRGTKKTRVNEKERWMSNVRSQRRALKELKKAGAKFKVSPRKIYRLIKGNFFKGKNHVLQFAEGGKK